MNHLAVRGRVRSLLAILAASAALAVYPAEVAVAADTTAPTITGPILSATTAVQGAPVSLSAGATDASGVVSAQVRIDGGAWTMMSPGLTGVVTQNRDAKALVNAGVAHVRAGAGFTCSVMADGTVRCWGDNGSGQLGDGTTTSNTFPVAVAGISTATAVTTGNSHACALLTNGTIRCWGANGHGQLGNGTATSSGTPVTVGITTQRAVAVAAGTNHTCASLSDGSVRCWGDNGFGQVGGSSTTDVPTPVAIPGISTASSVTTGDAHSCALLANHTIRCWGYNAFGQLGDGTTDGGPTAVVVSGITTATAIDAGRSHTCARLSNSAIKCWGDNHFGQLGDGTTTDRDRPVATAGLTTATVVTAGDDHACARLSNGALRCWGANASGQLGDGTGTARTRPVPVVGVTGAVSVTAGRNHTCARLSDSTVRCWGDDGSGQLGYSLPPNLSSTPIKVPTITAASAIGVGFNHTCAILTDKTIRCWGLNDWGQLGDGTYSTTAAPVKVSGIATAVAVGGGQRDSCALLADGSVKCWGTDNVFESDAPVSIPGVAHATQLSVGLYHACARISDGTIRCWGHNPEGELGDGSTYDRASGVKVYGIANAVAVQAGYFHTCAALADGKVKCWGSNTYGQLGDGTSMRRSTPVEVAGISTATGVEAGLYFSCAGLADGTVRCWGNGGGGLLGDGGGGAGSNSPVHVVGLSAATSLSALVEHTCAQLSNGEIRCWGRNGSGQLGDGSLADRPAPVGVLGISTASSIAAGENHTCALLSDHTIRCWGSNGFGQLGVSFGSLPPRPPLDGVFGPLAAGSHTICVRATDSAGNISGGKCATLTVTDTTVPTATAPTTSLRAGQALAATSLSVSLAWTGADNSGGLGVDHYELAKSTDGGSTWSTLTSSRTSPSFNTTLDTTGTTKFRVRAVDGADNIGAWATGPVLTPRLIQQDSSGFTLTGTWTTGTSASYSAGTVRYASTAGASLSYTFTGRSIAFVTTKAASRGAVKVYLDDVLAATVDTYSTTTAYQVQAWAKTFAAPGTHAIKLVVVGTTGRPRVDLDALATIVTDEPVPPPTTGGTPPPTTGGNGGGTLTPPATTTLEARVPAADGGLSLALAIGGLLALSAALIALRPRQKRIE